MIFKRLINMAVSVPLFFALAYLTGWAVEIYYAGTKILFGAVIHGSGGMGHGLCYDLMGLLRDAVGLLFLIPVCAIFFYLCMLALFKGYGVPFRRIDKDYILVDEKFESVRDFEETVWISWLHPDFRKYKLVHWQDAYIGWHSCH